MNDVNNLPGEFFIPLKRCLDLLNTCNITFFDKEKTLYKYIRYVYMVSCVMVFHTSQGVYLHKVFYGELQLFELAYIVPVYIVCTQTILKAIVVSSNTSRIKTLIIELGGIWRTEELTEVQKEKKEISLKRLNFFYKAFYWMNLLGSWQYMLAPIVETFIHRYIFKQDFELLLPFSCAFPFDPTENWLTYVFTYLLQLYSMFLIIYCYLGSEFLMITLCALLSIEFTLLSEDLLHVVPDKKYRIDNIIEMPNQHHTLKDVVQRHQKLIKLTEELDDIFNKMIFFNLSSATIIIGFFGFSATVASGALQMANNFIGSIVSVLPIFNLCYYADLLREASSGISDTAYNNIWYKGKKCYQKSILIILRRSQKPCCMTSMKYNKIALHTFTAVLSTTWSYFSLASNLYEN